MPGWIGEAGVDQHRFSCSKVKELGAPAPPPRLFILCRMQGSPCRHHHPQIPHPTPRLFLKLKFFQPLLWACKETLLCKFSLCWESFV